MPPLSESPYLLAEVITVLADETDPIAVELKGARDP
jgi:hypothetical protein